MASSERIFALLDTRAERGATASRKSAPRRSGPASRSSFEDVWFAYDVAHMAKQLPDSEHDAKTVEWVLKGVSFTARAGRDLAWSGTRARERRRSSIC